MTAEQKAKELVNYYYSHSKSQLQAIEIVERITLTNMCQLIGKRNELNMVWVMNGLEWQRQIAIELESMKTKIKT